MGDQRRATGRSRLRSSYMLEISLILFTGLAPAILSIFLVGKVEARARERFQAARVGTYWHQWSASPLQAPDCRYVEGVGYLVGDITCRYNARSAHLRCAVNPLGSCEGCSHYESIDLY
jgi:hypothetical protein